MPTNRTFLQLTLAIEMQFRPKFIRLAMEVRRQAIRALKEGGVDHARGKLSTIQLDVYPVLLAIYRKAGVMGARMTYNDLRKAAQQKAGGFGRNEQWIRAVLLYLQTNGLDMAQNITDTMKEDIIAILQKGIDQGLGIDLMVREMQRTDLVEARANLIARTETIRAANVGHAIGAQSSPYEVTKKWSAARDERTRPSHRNVHGITIDEFETFKVAIYKKGKPTGAFDNMQFPGDKGATAGNVCNCFLPDELTSVNPKIIKHALRSLYDGEVTTIHTTGGKKFTCTPNHPILTTVGWVKAGNLTDAHNLVKSSLINDHALPEFNVQNSPSTFEQVFNSLSEKWVAMRVPRAVVDFYGDIPASDVDIIRSASELPHGVEASSTKGANEYIFKNANNRKPLLFANRLLNRIGLMKFFRFLSNGFVCIGGQLGSFFGRGLSHSQVHRFASISGGNFCFPQSPVNDIPANAVFFGKLFNANTRSIFTDKNIDINGNSVAVHFNPSSPQTLIDKGSTCAETVCDFLICFPGLVKSDGVVKVEARNYYGHIYTFETVNQMYDINSYIAMNCRCRAVYLPKRDANGRLIMRQSTGATIIPMNGPTRYTPAAIAAALKAHIYIGVEEK